VNEQLVAIMFSYVSYWIVFSLHNGTS